MSPPAGTEIPAGRSVLAKVSAQRVTAAELVNAKAKPIGVVCNTLPTGIAAQQAGVNITTENRQIILNVQGSTPNGHWTVYTLTGQIVAQGTFEELSAGQTSITVPVTGQYMVKVTGPNLNIIKIPRFTVQLIHSIGCKHSLKLSFLFMSDCYFIILIEHYT